MPSAYGAAARRERAAAPERPLAAVLACSDARVSPEVLFGCGTGELHVVRNFGGTAEPGAVAALEHAVGELDVPLLVVLGHARCDAVAAALAVVERQAVQAGGIAAAIEPILPAVLRARAEARGAPREALLEAAVRASAQRAAERLRDASTIVRDAVRAGRLRIVAGRYDLDSGHVEFLL